jgi:predicted transglutaminase-like cysteine proteinase
LHHHLLFEGKYTLGGNFIVMAFLQKCWIIFFFLLVSVVPIIAEESFVIGESTIRRAESQYGPSARTRLLAWQNLIQNQDGDDLAKLKKVNDFFNKIPYMSDTSHWGKENYWATPTEFLASNGGDCKDYAIAKYFTLISLGVAEKKLFLTYVTALRLQQFHLVLAYYPGPGQEPLVLDSLVGTIEPSSRRTDLLPIYSFNASGLWEATQRGQGEKIGDSRRVKPWRELLIRMDEESHSK